MFPITKKFRHLERSAIKICKSDLFSLGSIHGAVLLGVFVEKLLNESDERTARQFSGRELREKASARIKEACEEEGINFVELKGGGRRGHLSRVRSKLASELVEKYGLTLAETARQLGVSTSAVCKMMNRVQDSSST